MVHLRRNLTRSGWQYLTVLLLVLYVCQVFPHDHCDSRQADHDSGHHEAVVPLTHHAHSPLFDKTEEAGHGGHHDHSGHTNETHHHEITPHVDSHFVRTLTQELNVNPDVVSIAVQVRPASKNDRAGTIWSDVDTPLPESVTISPPNSRAPPHCG